MKLQLVLSPGTISMARLAPVIEAAQTASWEPIVVIGAGAYETEIMKAVV